MGCNQPKQWRRICSARSASFSHGRDAAAFDEHGSGFFCPNQPLGTAVVTSRGSRTVCWSSRSVGDVHEDSVPELADTKRTVEAMVEVGNLLKSRDNADAIIMGCAGMADYRQTIEDRLQIPVIEPGQAAVAVATTAARQGW